LDKISYFFATPFALSQSSLGAGGSGLDAPAQERDRFTAIQGAVAQAASRCSIRKVGTGQASANRRPQAEDFRFDSSAPEAVLAGD
jgi:hypothetical protein